MNFQYNINVLAYTIVDRISLLFSVFPAITLPTVLQMLCLLYYNFQIAIFVSVFLFPLNSRKKLSSLAQNLEQVLFSCVFY